MAAATGPHSRLTGDGHGSYLREHEIASLAVQRAVLVSKKVLSSVDRGELAKGDDSPVSLADFASQALIVAALHAAFPSDRIVGEEDASSLRQDIELAEAVWKLVSSTRLDDDNAEQLLARPKTRDEMLDFIDLAGNGHLAAVGRVWTIDPIDGTLTYLQGTQYCVVASLIENGKQVLTTIACPHIRLDLHGDEGKRPSISESATDVDKSEGAGFIISAIRNQGVWARPLGSGSLLNPERVATRKHVLNASDLVFAESTQPSTPQFEDRHLIAHELGAPWPASGPVKIYSTQLRYIALALGACDVALRVPQDKSHHPWVWDYAGGILLYEESGGKVTDLRGREVDMTSGRRLTTALGILAAPAHLHESVLTACQKVLGEYEGYREYVNGHLKETDKHSVP